MDVKEPITFEAQLQKLKERGCIVEDEQKAIEVLKNINYYRLTAYFLSFKKDEKTFRAFHSSSYGFGKLRRSR